MKTEVKSGHIRVSNVNKIYRTYPTPRHRLLEMLSGGRMRYMSEKRALDEVSFELEPGGRLGIIGENGSGKSTLLKVIAGVLAPSSGEVVVKGRVSSLLELGAGFSPDLRGVENIRQFCLLHGMPSGLIEEAVPQIIQFSELGEAVNHPVKTYSSGMSVRLGFACAVYVQPDILIVDEALSVGDAYFQNKCLHKIKSMLDAGTTFIYVTHVADSIRSLCDKGIWMDHGRIRMCGTAADVGAAYQAEVYRRMVHAGFDRATSIEGTKLAEDACVEQGLKTMVVDHARHAAFSERVAPLRTGSGEIRVQDIVVLNVDGEDSDRVEFGARVRIQVWYKVQSLCEKRCSVALGVADSSGKEIVHFNSIYSECYLNTGVLGLVGYVEFEFDNPLCPGEFGLVAGVGVMSPSLANGGQYICQDVIDYCVGGARFAVSYPHSSSKHDLWGLVHVPYVVSDHGAI